jgi:hypothetical protein
MGFRAACVMAIAGMTAVEQIHDGHRDAGAASTIVAMTIAGLLLDDSFG